MAPGPSSFLRTYAYRRTHHSLDHPWTTWRPVFLTSPPQGQFPTSGDRRHPCPALPTHLVLVSNKRPFHVCEWPVGRSRPSIRQAHLSLACVPPRGIRPRGRVRYSKAADRLKQGHRPTFEGTRVVMMTGICHSAGGLSPPCSPSTTHGFRVSMQCPTPAPPPTILPARIFQSPTPRSLLISPPIIRTGGIGKVPCPFT